MFQGLLIVMLSQSVSLLSICLTQKALQRIQPEWGKCSGQVDLMLKPSFWHCQRRVGPPGSAASLAKQVERTHALILREPYYLGSI